MEKAFVKYDAANRLIPGLLRTGSRPPSGKGWVEVASSLCCSSVSFPAQTIANTFKGYIRFNKKGRVVGGSTIISKKIPSDGKWAQIPYNRCC